MVSPSLVGGCRSRLRGWWDGSPMDLESLAARGGRSCGAIVHD